MNIKPGGTFSNHGALKCSYWAITFSNFLSPPFRPEYFPRYVNGIQCLPPYETSFTTQSPPDTSQYDITILNQTTTILSSTAGYNSPSPLISLRYLANCAPDAGTNERLFMQRVSVVSFQTELYYINTPLHNFPVPA